MLPWRPPFGLGVDPWGLHVPGDSAIKAWTPGAPMPLGSPPLRRGVAPWSFHAPEESTTRSECRPGCCSTKGGVMGQRCTGEVVEAALHCSSIGLLQGAEGHSSCSGLCNWQQQGAACYGSYRGQCTGSAVGSCTLRKQWGAHWGCRRGLWTGAAARAAGGFSRAPQYWSEAGVRGCGGCKNCERWGRRIRDPGEGE